jgi:hypothetical protein
MAVNVFYPGRYRGPELEEATRVCDRCPVKLTCLAEALQREAGQPLNYRAGVWGGTTPAQRKLLSHALRERRVAAALAGVLEDAG